MQHSKRVHTSCGMSIIEMLVFIAVTTLIITAITSSILYFYRANTSVIEQAYHVNSARKGVGSLVRDVREATFGDDGSFPVIELGANHFYFYSDIDRDNSTERVRYYLVGTNLYKGVTNPSGSPLAYNDADEELSIVSDAVRNEEESVPIFRYYDSGGNEILNYSDISQTSFVTVNLIVNINPIRKPDEFTLRSSATIRNLKINL